MILCFQGGYPLHLSSFIFYSIEHTVCVLEKLCSIEMSDFEKKYVLLSQM